MATGIIVAAVQANSRGGNSPPTISKPIPFVCTSNDKGATSIAFRKAFVRDDLNGHQQASQPTACCIA
jgi:hypothetical protein